ncbi:hypothetical protein AgCh_025178 [Apium graveolens]
MKTSLTGHQIRDGQVLDYYQHQNPLVPAPALRSAKVTSYRNTMDIPQKGIESLREILVMNIRLGPQAPQFMEVPMVDEEWEAFEDILEDGGEMLVVNLVLKALGAQNEEPQIQEVVFEDELFADSEEDEDDLFDLF